MFTTSFRLLSALTLTLTVAACDQAGGPAPGPSKEEIAQVAGKGDHGIDWCEAYGWYDDGVCDVFCTDPDPDCGLTSCDAEIEGEKLLVALENGGAVMLDAATGKVLHSYATGANAFGAAFTPDGRRAFVTDKDAGTLVEIDPDSSDIVDTLVVGKTTQQPAITETGRVYIPLAGDAAVAVVDIEDGLELLRTIPIGTGTKPHIVSLSPDGKTLWVTVQGMDPKVVSIPITAAGEGTAKEYRYDIVPRVVSASNAGAWFTAHHSTGLHRVKLSDGVVSTPYMDVFGAATEARKQIEGVSVSASGNLFALTHEGRKALVVAEFRGNGTTETLLDVAPLANVPYWTTLDPAQEVVYVSIPNAGLVEAYGIEGCGEAPIWTTNVGGKAKRMDVTVTE